MGKGPAAGAAKGMPAISAPRGTPEFRRQIAARAEWIDDQLKYRGETLDSLGIKDEEGQARGAYRTYGPGGYFSEGGSNYNTNFIYDWASGKKLDVATNAEAFKDEAMQNSQGQWVFDPAKAKPERWAAITPEEFASRNDQQQWNTENPGLSYADRVAMQGMKEMVGRGHFTYDPQTGNFFNFRNNNPNDIEMKDKFGRLVGVPDGWKPLANSPVWASPGVPKGDKYQGGSAQQVVPPGVPGAPGSYPTVPGAPATPPAPPTGKPGKPGQTQGTSGQKASVPSPAKFTSPLEEAIMSAFSSPGGPGGPDGPLYDTQGGGGGAGGGTPKMPESEPEWEPPPPGSPGFPAPPEVPPAAPPTPPPGPPPPPSMPPLPPLGGGFGLPGGGGGGYSPPPPAGKQAWDQLSMTGDPLQDALASLFNYRAGIFGTENPLMSGATSRAPTDKTFDGLKTGTSAEKPTGKALPIGATALSGGGVWWGEKDDLASALAKLGLGAGATGGGGGGGGSHGGHGGGGGYGSHGASEDMSAVEELAGIMGQPPPSGQEVSIPKQVAPPYKFDGANPFAPPEGTTQSSLFGLPTGKKKPRSPLEVALTGWY